jgi:peptidyl-tRNA hydrolase, PTH1 family
VIIIYDDIDLDFGKIKISIDRSSGGHNGVQSVIDHIASKNFYRLRIGIGGKPHKEMLLQDYVLSKLSQEELTQLNNPAILSEIILRIKSILK